MPNLYVANCTKQRHEFVYRLAEQKDLKTQVIEIGSQILVNNKDLHDDEIDSIIKQHELYGLVNANKIDSTKGFIGMCYSIDKPININKIISAWESNDAALEKAVAEHRQEMAAVISHNLNEIARGEKNDLSSIEIETKELPLSGKDVNFTETIAVEKPGKKSKRG